MSRLPRDTPRERVANHLKAHGIEVHPDDIRVPEGFYRQIRADVQERWNVRGFDASGRQVEVTGLDSLTLCYRGIKLEPNPANSEVYGDWVANALHR
jgi:hypothetical protein